jgi:hypothetical protein
MLKKLPRLVLIAIVLAALPLLASAQTDRLVQAYTDLAGSETNARSLVTGLRDGTEVKLGSGTTTTSFTPPTGKMGYGEVDISLGLAEKLLAQQGFTDPSAAQVKTALIGDTQHPGILQLRADGQGWGQIANSLGFRLGDVMRSDKAGSAPGMSNRPERVTRAERPDRPEKPERPDRPERPGKR